MNKRFVILILLFTIGFYLQIPAQGSGSEANIKAVLIYNFAKFFHWPTGAHDDDFKIGIAGNHSIAEALRIISQKKLIKNAQTIVEEINSTDSVSKYNMVFLSIDSSISFTELLKKIENKAILVISEKEGLCQQGSSINLIKRDDKVKFEINLSALRKSGIESNTQFVKLAEKLYN